MDKLELLKKAKEKVDALVAEKQRAEAESTLDDEATDLAVRMQMHDDLVTSIKESAIDPEQIAESFREAIANIIIPAPQVTVPEIKLPPINVPEAKVTVSIPEIKLPTINVPEPRVTVNVPEIKVPDVTVNMPDSMEIHGDVGLFGYGFDNPLPVQLRDANGNPVNLGELAGGQVSGGGGRFVKVTNDADSPIPITGNITSTPGATYYASDAIGSVNIVQSIPIDVTVIGATGTMGVVTINPDGLPVYGSSSGGGLTDAELRASSIPVEQVSGSIWSTSVIGTVPVSGTFYQATQPVSGTVTVASVTASTAVALTDSTGVQYSGSNPVPTKELKPATGTNSSVADNAASTTILASNTARIGATVYNDSSATLYLLLGSTAASTTNYTCQVASLGYYEVPFGYTGQLTGIWASDPGDGAARVTEIT